MAGLTDGRLFDSCLPKAPKFLFAVKREYLASIDQSIWSSEPSAATDGVVRLPEIPHIHGVRPLHDQIHFSRALHPSPPSFDLRSFLCQSQVRQDGAMNLDIMTCPSSPPPLGKNRDPFSLNTARRTVPPGASSKTRPRSLAAPAGPPHATIPQHPTETSMQDPNPFRTFETRRLKKFCKTASLLRHPPPARSAGRPRMGRRGVHEFTAPAPRFSNLKLRCRARASPGPPTRPKSIPVLCTNEKKKKCPGSSQDTLRVSSVLCASRKHFRWSCPTRATRIAPLPLSD
jgi:hypothetical protein